MSLVLHYAMNSAVDAELGIDSAGSSLNATNNTVTSFADPTYGNVAYFDGSSDLQLGVASVPAAMVSSASRTVSMWIRRISANNGIITSAGDQSVVRRRYRLQINTDDTVDLQYFNTTASSINTAMGLGWRHLTFTYNGTTSKGYLDGVQGFSVAKSLFTVATDLGIGIDPTGGSTIQYNGYMTDYRIYDDALDATAVGTLFSTGPSIGFTLSATMYTHLADLTWGTVSGATNYTITQTEDAGPETTIVSETVDSVVTYETLPGSAYIYNIYSDLDLVTPAATISETADLVTTVTVQELLTRISNDLTTLTETALVEIDGELRNALTTGDVVLTDEGNATFVSDADTLTLPPGYIEKVLVPFDTSSGASQTVTITLPDASSEVFTYDDGADEVISGAVNYAVGEYFKSGTYKVTVTEL